MDICSFCRNYGFHHILLIWRCKICSNKASPTTPERIDIAVTHSSQRFCCNGRTEPASTIQDNSGIFRDWMFFDITFNDPFTQVERPFVSACFVFMLLSYVNNDNLSSIVQHRYKLSDIAFLNCRTGLFNCCEESWTVFLSHMAKPKPLHFKICVSFQTRLQIWSPLISVHGVQY